MMGIDSIIAASRNATLEARRNKREPFTVTAEDIAGLKAGAAGKIRFPFVGAHVAPGWERVDLIAHHGRAGAKGQAGNNAYYCDTSGDGLPSEPALTQRQLAEVLRPGFGYAVIEQGQFQAYLACYRKVLNASVEGAIA